MFKILANAWKVKDIRTKLLFILLVLAIYTLGTNIPLPGIDLASFQAYKAGGNTQSFASQLLGGKFGTIFYMGIGPYITASIILQLLTVAIPKLESIQKEGEEGRKKINQYTRITAVVLACLQACGTVYTISSLFKVNVIGAPTYQIWLTYAMAVIALVTGTILIMWLGELLTEKGIGNGSSFIIFANILTGLPRAVNMLYQTALGGTVWDWIKVIVIILLFVGVMAFVVLVQDGERRIPVQYSKKTAGKIPTGGQSSYIPIKVNIAGVMSIIFAISLLQFPSTIHQLWQPAWLDNVVKVLAITAPVGAILYVILIFCFTFFYTSFAINPVEMAENMKKNGGFVPGIRPGKPTSDYIQRTVDRLSWIGAFFYALIAVAPIIFDVAFNIRVGFGGTTLLIVTGVALDIVKQLEAQLLMRHYKGFLN